MCNINSSLISWIRNTGTREQNDAVSVSCTVFNDVIVLGVVVCLLKSREISLSTWDHTSLSIILTRPCAMAGGCWPISVWTNTMSLHFLYRAITRILCFSKSCNKTAYHWWYFIHRITTKPVGLKWFDTLTFTGGADHRVTAHKWTSADLMLGQRRGQVR